MHGVYLALLLTLNPCLALWLLKDRRKRRCFLAPIYRSRIIFYCILLEKLHVVLHGAIDPLLDLSPYLLLPALDEPHITINFVELGLSNEFTSDPVHFVLAWHAFSLHYFNTSLDTGSRSRYFLLGRLRLVQTKFVQDLTDVTLGGSETGLTLFTFLDIVDIRAYHVREQAER